MENRRSRHLKTLFVVSMAAGSVHAQGKAGIENYHFLSPCQSYVWMPVGHYEGSKGFYSELRYNYEEMGTVSLFAGRSIAINKNSSWHLIPMIGVSAGNFKGVSVATRSEIEWDRFFVSTEMQYSVAFSKGSSNFFFNWSELGYTVSKNIFAGLSIQFTQQQRIGVTEPGLMAGLSVKNFTFPLYVFKPFNKNQYVILGINYEFQLKNQVNN